MQLGGLAELVEVAEVAVPLAEDERQVVQRGGGSECLHFRRRLCQRLLEGAPGIGQPAHAQGATGQHRQGLHPGVLIAAAAYRRQRA